MVPPLWRRELLEWMLDAVTLYFVLSEEDQTTRELSVPVFMLNIFVYLHVMYQNNIACSILAAMACC